MINNGSVDQFKYVLNFSEFLSLSNTRKPRVNGLYVVIFPLDGQLWDSTSLAHNPYSTSLKGRTSIRGNFPIELKLFGKAAKFAAKLSA
jgi:hypothetical protein